MTEEKNNAETGNTVPAKPLEQTEISADIGNIGKNADAKISRLQEKNTPPAGTGEQDESTRDFKLNVTIERVEGKLSLADVIRENTLPAKKKIIL
ncbi:MAG: hypothetical protein GY757_49880 [bacterium]|nr:hypothetical protein [bacterium]